MSDLLFRLRSLFRRKAVDAELDDELKFHFERQVEKLVQSGLTREEAHRRARLEFGGLDQVKEECRDARGVNFIETTIQDLRYALRQLRRSPGFSVLAILCLTLGIGANTAVYSWIEGILFRPFPLVSHQERLFAMEGTARGVAGFDDVSWPDFLDLQKNCTLADSFIAEKIAGANIGIGDRALRAPGSVVSANYFDSLGIHPVLGRGFEPSENSGRNAHPVVVIAYQLWQNRFHGDPGVVGKTVMLNRVQHTIVGVAPQGFYGTFVGHAFQFWVPVSMQETFEPGGYKLEDRGARWIEGFVRLRPGVTRQQAQQEISAVASRLERDYPATNRGRGIRLFPLWQTPFNSASDLLPTLGVALAVVVAVLLIACANVGNLLLVRSFARRHEMTVRLAVGAGRGRLVRQLLTEGLVLSVLAAAGGLMMAQWLRNALVLLIPWRGVPVYLPGELDGRVLLLSAGVCLLSTLLSGLVPAIQAGRIDVAAVLNSESAGVVGGRGKAWVRSGLVLVQMSLSFILLVGAGLVLRSLHGLRTSSPGFSTRGVLMTGVGFAGSGYDTQRERNSEDELMSRVQALAGVESAAYARVAPFSLIDYSNAPISVDGYHPARDEQPTADYNEVGPHYFVTMGIPLVSGRAFTRADDEASSPVAVVNERMVAQYWRGMNPIGKRLRVKGRWMQVVGVARDVKYRSFLEPPTPFFYLPLRQNFSSRVVLLIRTPQTPEAMAAPLARELRALDPEMALYEVITTEEQVDRTTSSQRIAVALLGVFGGLALLLAAIGLYAVMSYSVSQRRRDFGLRMALGADISDLLRIVVSHGLALTAGGAVLGGAAALILTRLLGYLLYNVSPRDPLTFAVAFVVMIVTALAACLVPGWRAAKTHPMVALRYE